MSDKFISSEDVMDNKYRTQLLWVCAFHEEGSKNKPDYVCDIPPEEYLIMGVLHMLDGSIMDISLTPMRNGMPDFEGDVILIKRKTKDPSKVYFSEDEATIKEKYEELQCVTKQ